MVKLRKMICEQKENFNEETENISKTKKILELRMQLVNWKICSMGWYIPSTGENKNKNTNKKNQKTKNLPTENTVSSINVFQKWRRDLPGWTKIVGVHHH